MSAIYNYLAVGQAQYDRSLMDARRLGLTEERQHQMAEQQRVEHLLRMRQFEQSNLEDIQRGEAQAVAKRRADAMKLFESFLSDDENLKTEVERLRKDAQTELGKLNKAKAQFSNPEGQLTSTAGKLLASIRLVEGPDEIAKAAETLFETQELYEIQADTSKPAVSPYTSKKPNFLLADAFLGRIGPGLSLDSSDADIRVRLAEVLDPDAVDTAIGHINQYRDQEKRWSGAQKKNAAEIARQERIVRDAAGALTAETTEERKRRFSEALVVAGEMESFLNELMPYGDPAAREMADLYGGDAGGLSPMQKHTAMMSGQMPSGIPQESVSRVQQLVATQKRLSTDPSFLKWAAQNGISVQKGAVVPVNVFMRWNNEVIGKGRLGWRYKGKRGRDLRGTGAVFEVTYRAGDDFDIGLRSAGGAQLFAVDESGDYLSPDRVSNKHRDDFAEAQVVTADLDDAQTRGEIVSLLSTAGEGGREMAKAIGQAYAGDSKGDFQVFLDKSGKAALVGANGKVVKAGGFDAKTAALSDAARDVNGPFVVAGTSSAMQDRTGGNALGNLDGFVEGQTADFGVYVPKGLRLVTKEPTATLIAEEALHRAGSPGDETVYFWDDEATGTRQSITLKDGSTTNKELFDAKQQLDRGDNRFRVLGRERRRVKLAKRMSPADPAARRARTPGSLEVSQFTAEELRKRKEATSAPPEPAPTPAPAAPEAEPPVVAAPEAESPVVEKPSPVMTDVPKPPKKPSGKKPSGTKPGGTADLTYVPEGFEAKPGAAVADVTQTIDEATSRSVVAESDPETGAQTVRTDLMRDADAERERLERERELKRQKLIAANNSGAASGRSGG